jgi:peptide/nickel transport system permease protein
MTAVARTDAAPATTPEEDRTMTAVVHRPPVADAAPAPDADAAPSADAPSADARSGPAAPGSRARTGGRRRPDARRRSLPAAGLVLAVAFLALVAVAVAVPGILAPFDPDAPDPARAFAAPDLAHLFGTDQSGRDLFSRVVHGARQSVLVGVAAALIGVGGGGALGLLAALGGRFTDSVVSRVVEVLFAFPALLLALLFVTILGTGIGPAAVAVGIGTAPGYARMVRATAQQVAGSGYVEAARALGWSSARVTVRTIVPNVVRPLLVLGTLGIGQAVVWASSLSFLGLGAQPPAAEWGTMLADGRSYVQIAWWIAVFPGLAITLTAVSTTVVGRALQRRLDGRTVR